LHFHSEFKQKTKLHYAAFCGNVFLQLRGSFKFPQAAENHVHVTVFIFVQ